MGIFSRKEQIPDPQVTIQLEPTKDGPYFSGDTLSGIVSISSPVPRQLQYANLSFSGQAFTHSTRQVTSGSNVGAVNNRRTRIIRYEDRVQLFGIDQGLLQATTLVPEKPLEFPFSFTVPIATADVTGPPPYNGDTARSGMYAATGHTLPPTFQHVKTDRSYAHVEYGLQAALVFDDTDGVFNSGQSFPFSPVRDSRQQPDMRESIRPPQPYASSRLTGGEKSAMNSFRDRFTSATPSVNVLMRAKVPSFAPTSTAFNIFACVEIDAFSMPNIDIPRINISVKSVKIVPITFYRALRVSGHSMDRNEHEVIDEESIQLNAVPPTQAIDKKEIGDSGEKEGGGASKWVYPVSFEARIPGNICPSFQTSNINRSYRLKVSIEADICGKEFEHKFEANIGVAPSVAA